MKQNRVKLLLEQNNYEIETIDKQIKGSCYKERPDFVIDAGTHYIIIEIDENQHATYNDVCEEIRMKIICHSIGMPVIFIRYNPDGYTDSDKKKGKLTREDREKILLKWLNLAISSRPKNTEEFLRITYLFYNGYDSSKNTLDTIKFM